MVRVLAGLLSARNGVWGLLLCAVIAVGCCSAAQASVATEFDADRAASGEILAINQTHKIRTWFTDTGALTTPQDALSPDSATWQWGLSLRRYGWAGGAMTAPASATPHAERNIVTYQRGTELREWYTNDAAGLRSWYELKSAPPGSGNTLRLELAVQGSTRAVLHPAGDRIEFLAPDGAAVVHYSGLKVWDATGRLLPSRLSVDGDRVVLLDADVTGASFPITIDPLATEPVWGTSTIQYGSFAVGDTDGNGCTDIVVIDQSSLQPPLRFFLGSSAGVSTTPAWTYNNFNDLCTGANDWSAFLCLDSNGDGFSDFVVGNFCTSPKAWKTFFGSAAGLTSVPVSTMISGSFDGGYLSAAGDINGDGCQDVFAKRGGGGFHLFYGSNNGLAGSPSLEWLSFAIPSTGDVNQDGFTDILIGEPSYGDGKQPPGRVSLYLGSANGLTSVPAWIGTGDQYGVWYFGDQLIALGDINGDGYPDFADSHMILYGTGSGFSSESLPSPSFMDENPIPVGDIDWDGYSDVATNTTVYFGSQHGLNALQAWPGLRLGADPRGASDMNGDGYSDVLAVRRYGLYPFSFVDVFAFSGGPSEPTSAALSVAGNGIVVAPEDRLPDVRDNTDFSTVSIVKKKTNSFSLINTGSDPLRFAGAPSVRFLGTNAADFSVVDIPPSVLDPGTSAEITIRANPAGLGTRRATVVIPSNDETSPYAFDIAATGVLPCADRYDCWLDRQYEDILNRPIDPAGRDYFVGLLCNGEPLENVAKSLLLSPEYADTVGFVARCYFGIFNNNSQTTPGSIDYRIPDYEGLQFWSNTMRQTSLPQGKLAVVNGFTSSSEWQARVGDRDNAGYVDFLYENILGRPADAVGKQYWVAQLDGGADRAGLALGFLDSSECRATYNNRVRVSMAYLGYLRRTPEPSGFLYHLNRLDGGVSLQQIVGEFIHSVEYKGRLSGNQCFDPQDMPPATEP